MGKGYRGARDSGSRFLPPLQLCNLSAVLAQEQRNGESDLETGKKKYTRRNENYGEKIVDLVFF